LGNFVPLKFRGILLATRNGQRTAASFPNEEENIGGVEGEQNSRKGGREGGSQKKVTTRPIGHLNSAIEGCSRVPEKAPCGEKMRSKRASRIVVDIAESTSGSGMGLGVCNPVLRWKYDGGQEREYDR